MLCLSSVLLLGFFGTSSAVVFPDERRLSEVSQITDVIEIEFEPSAYDLGLEQYTQNILDSTGCSSCKRIFRPAGKHEAKHMEAGLHLWHKCTCDSSAVAESSGYSEKGMGAKSAISRLKDAILNNGNEWFGLRKVSFSPEIVPTVVKGSEKPVKRRKTTNMKGSAGRRSLATVDDPLFYAQEKHYDAIGLASAWDILEQNGAWDNAKDVVVHVLDSGWDLSHEDLGANKWINPGESSCDNNSDEDENGYADDCHGYNHADDTGTDLLGDSNHGTHVTGTISANTDNGVGVAGVAGGLGGANGVSIMAGVAFGSGGAGGFEDAIIYAADNGAHISSNSWGYTSPGSFPEAMKQAIDYAVDAGVIVVFAAGNDGNDGEYYPAYYENVLAVAAVDNDSNAASFTNYGSWVDISAPGVEIASTSTGGEYVYLSGTSMACPHVSAVLGLGVALGMATQGTKPSPTLLLDCLFSTADNIDDLQSDELSGKLGAGLMNAPSFLNCVLDSTPSPVSSPVSTSSPVSSPVSTPSPTSSPVSTPTPVSSPVSTPSPVSSPVPTPTPVSSPVTSPISSPGCSNSGQACSSYTTCDDLGYLGGTLVCTDTTDANTCGCNKLVYEMTGLSGSADTEMNFQVPISHVTEKNAQFLITGGTGDADLYVKFDSPPTTTFYDCRPYDEGNEEICEATEEIPMGTYHIMIRGYSEFSDVDFRVITDGDVV